MSRRNAPQVPWDEEVKEFIIVYLLFFTKGEVIP